MSEYLTADERKALKRALEEINEKGWGIGLGLASGVGLFAATNFLVLKGGSHVGSHLQLLRVYFPGYSVSLAGSLIGFVYAFVIGYGVGRSVATMYYRFAVWMG